MFFAIFRVVSHGVGWCRLGNGLEEDGAPGNVDVGLAQSRRKIHLEAGSVSLSWAIKINLGRSCIPR